MIAADAPKYEGADLVGADVIAGDVLNTSRQSNVSQGVMPSLPEDAAQETE